MKRKQMSEKALTVRRDTVKDTTVNTALRMVRAFLYYCMERGWMGRSTISQIKVTQPVKEPYTNDELARLLKKPDLKTCTFARYRNWVIVNFLLATGCRASALINLRIMDIDLSGGTVFFRHTYAKLFIMAGGDPFRLQKLLGHTDLSMTKRYVALYADDLKENYDTFNPLEQMSAATKRGTKKKLA